MRNNIVITIVLLACLSFPIFSCSRVTTEPTKEITTQENATQALYTCPMHREVTSTKVERCPQCGMMLEKIEENK